MKKFIYHLLLNVSKLFWKIKGYQKVKLMGTKLNLSCNSSLLLSW